jgi:asparagine synthase (glutamine-hydrolysing)
VLKEESLEIICAKLREILDHAVQRNIADCVLLSGGLDTSLVTAVATRHRKLTGVTVSLNSGPDIPFARQIANKFMLKHLVVEINEGDTENAAREVVRVMQSFDPMEVRNDVAIQIGLHAARAAGFNEVMTGDGGDELFAGYSFFFGKPLSDLESSLCKMWRIMRFSSTTLALSLNMTAKLPFLDREFKEFAMDIPVNLKVRKEKGQTNGKWILRKAFEEELPAEIVWRVKMPIEQGSGTASLPSYFERRISDGIFEAKRREYKRLDGVKLRSKEHLAYYELYRTEFGSPRDKGTGTKLCDCCGARVDGEANYCRTCGAYPA